MLLELSKLVKEMSLSEPVKPETFNIYEDSNIRESIESKNTLRKLRCSVVGLLKVYEDHPALIQVPFSWIYFYFFKYKLTPSKLLQFSSLRRFLLLMLFLLVYLLQYHCIHHKCIQLFVNFLQWSVIQTKYIK